MGVGIPVLSATGWVSNKSEIMIKLFEHFVTADYSQSNFFLGGIASLKYIIAVSNGAIEMKQNIIQALAKLYGAYFSSVTVNVSIDTSATSSVVTYTIDLVCHDELNQQYLLSKSISEQGGSLLNIDEIIANLRALRS